MKYPSEKADSLERFVRKSIPLSAVAAHIYGSIRWLEQAKGKSLCEEVFAGYREIAKEAHVDIKSVRRGLLELKAQGLIKVALGMPIKRMRKATSIQRYSLDAIKQHSTLGDSVASRLATTLNGRSFQYDGKEIRPVWRVAHTHRVCSSKPNIQGDSHGVRIEGLIRGLLPDQVVVHADIKRAEPTIIKYLLQIPEDRDLYGEYMAVTGCSRPDAKRAINTLAYCRKSMSCYAHWPLEARTALVDYAKALDAYKDSLFREAKKRRCVTTMSGRCIVAEMGCRLHAGRVLNWRVQGTVADIVNPACLRLLASASAVVPLHDAVYAILHRDQAHRVMEDILAEAHELGLKVKVEVKTYSSRLAVPKTTTAKKPSEVAKLCPNPPPITTSEVEVGELALL